MHVAIVGTGGMGRETAAWAQSAGMKVQGFLDDDPEKDGESIAGLPVLGPVALAGDGDWPVVVAVGEPRPRDRISNQLEVGGVEFGTVVHPSAVIGPDVNLGRGMIVGPNVVLTRDISLARSVIVNFGAVVGHDCRLGDAALIGPGASLAGTVTVQRRAQVGIAAAVIQGLTIHEDAIVAAGGVVIRDVPAGQTVGGVPATPIGG